MRLSSWMLLAVFVLGGCGAAAKDNSGASSPDPSHLTSSGGAAGATIEIERASQAIEAGDYEQARAILEEAARKAPGNGTAAYYLGVACEKLGDMPAAERHYQEAMRLAPELTEAAINLGALHIDAGNFDKAVAVTRAALKRQPNDAALQINLGMALEGQGDKQAAVEAYGRALQAGEANPTLRWQYAALLLETGEKARAAEELKLALSGAGEDRALLASIGRALGASGSYAECVKALDRAIALGDAAELRVGRGLCRHSLDDETGASADFEAAIGLAPEYAAAHYYLGRSLLALGKRDAAIRSLEKSAKLAEGTPLATKAREEAAAAKKKTKK